MAKVVTTCNSVFSAVAQIRDTCLSLVAQVIQRVEGLEQALNSRLVSESNAAVAKENEPFHTKDLPITNKEELKAFERKMAASPKARDQLASQP